jgi:hypothetical protein
MTRTNAQREAKEKGLTHYISQRACPKCGGYQRYAVSGRCSNLECRRKVEAEWRRKNPDKVQQKNRKRKMGYYGLSVDDFDILMEKQNNCCAICKKTCITGRALAIDHDHNTNIVRGLLCNKCNQGLGFFNDSIDLLEGAVLYLKQHSE